jgi:hypothetical protein
MLNAVLARAQRTCCAQVEALFPPAPDETQAGQRLVDMFCNEWALAGGGRRLGTIAIVDESPGQQYMYPEFLLFRELFERHGRQAVVAGPEALTWRDNRLWHDDTPIDLVYNPVAAAEAANALQFAA